VFPPASSTVTVHFSLFSTALKLASTLEAPTIAGIGALVAGAIVDGATVGPFVVGDIDGASVEGEAVDGEVVGFLVASCTDVRIEVSSWIQ